MQIAARIVVICVAGTLAPSVLAPSSARAQTPATERDGSVSASPDPNDELLRRVLRSGCRDGVDDVKRADAPWAATVARLCGEILAAPAPRPATRLETRPTTRATTDEGSGRGPLVVVSTLYGIWVGIAADVLFDVNGNRTVIIPPMLGMAAGLGLSLLATGAHPVTSGQAWTINTGLDYGSLDGALWAGGLDLSAKGVVGTALATGLTGGAIGLLVATKLPPRRGDIEIVRSGCLWGSVTGLLVALTVSSDPSQTTVLRSMGAAMDLGFLGGLALASTFDVSRNRALIIDAGTLGGGLAGLGITWLALSGPNASPRALPAGALGGLAAGLIAAVYFTRHLDVEDDGASDVAALFGRDARGRWALGSPGVTPVLDGTGTRFVGATFNLLAGSL